MRTKIVIDCGHTTIEMSPENKFEEQMLDNIYDTQGIVLNANVFKRRSCGYSEEKMMTIEVNEKAAK